MPQPKVSAVLLAFVEPLFLMPSGPPPEMYKQIMDIAVLVWNSVTFDDHHGTNFVGDIRARLQSIEDPRERAHMLALTEDFVDRRRGPFAEHEWLVGNWEIFYRSNGEPRVRVEARTIPPPP